MSTRHPQVGGIALATSLEFNPIKVTSWHAVAHALALEPAGVRTRPHMLPRGIGARADAHGRGVAMQEIDLSWNELGASFGAALAASLTEVASVCAMRPRNMSCCNTATTCYGAAEGGGCAPCGHHTASKRTRTYKHGPDHALGHARTRQCASWEAAHVGMGLSGKGLIGNGSKCK